MILTIFKVPCLSRMWAILALHNILFFLALSNIFLFTIPSSPCSAIRLHKLVSQITPGFPLSFNMSCEGQILIKQQLLIIKQNTYEKSGTKNFFIMKIFSNLIQFFLSSFSLKRNHFLKVFFVIQKFTNFAVWDPYYQLQFINHLLFLGMKLSIRWRGDHCIFIQI